jgi:hypothetical protein
LSTKKILYEKIDGLSIEEAFFQNSKKWSID